MAESELGRIDGTTEMRANEGIWMFDSDDWLLMAMLKDPVYCAELLFEDPKNIKYSGCYSVYDYQYPLFRFSQSYQIYPCARSVGKTESAKARAVSHAFRRIGEELLITAPELIHLEGLTGPIESRIMEVRLTRDFLRADGQRTGITHKPGLRVEFADGTSIAGRIPHQTGRGIKGAHVPDLIIDEAQDFPEKGYIEIQEVVMKDHIDTTGNYDFTYHAYGVYASGHGGKFQQLADSGLYKVTTITAPMRPGWNKAEKQSAAAMYGGTNSPDYRRNVLGEPGQSLSQFFVTAHLMACMDQDKESHYNTVEFRAQELRSEDLERLIGPKGDPGDLLDLPTNLGQEVYAGMDVGLVTDPTVIKIYTVGQDTKRKTRLKLVRMIHLWRFTEKQIRQCTYKMALTYGKTLRSFGQDIGGLGLPLYQAMEADEQCPAHLRDISRGYIFNAKVPVAVDSNYVSDQAGKLVDQYGHMVEEIRDKWTGKVQLVARMSMIEASTRYLRRWVDDGYLMFPFHPELIKDFQGETEQRVRAMAGARKKPNAFHMLDASRVMAMAFHAAQLEEQIYAPKAGPVLDRAVSV